jgi:NAD(P)-dependent dehydrogenase (short-subunit alcohol dehydrogenase family)
MAEHSESSFKLQDRTALLTGPCNTTNQAIAMKLTGMGVNVALVDRNIEKSQRFATQLMDQREAHERFGRAIAVQADLSKAHHIQDAIGKAAESFGGIDIYIDGLMTTEAKAFKDPTALDDIERVVDVNLRAPLMMTHAVLRYLESRKRGRIIYLVNDIARLGFTQNSLHTVTRMGLMSFARALSREVAESNVTVNCVALGLTEEFLLAQNGQEQVSIQESLTRVARSYPFAQMAEPEKAANIVAFLASPLGSGINGQTIAVSQGLSMMS